MPIRFVIALSVCLAAIASMAASTAFAQGEPSDDRMRANWSMNCDGDNCRPEAANQTEDGRDILRMWIGRGPENTLFLGAIVPLGLHIPNGVILSFDEGQTAHHQMRLLSCHPTGCRAVAPLNADLEQRMRAGAQVAVVIRDTESRTDLALLMGLWGFSAALDQFRAMQ